MCQVLGDKSDFWGGCLLRGRTFKDLPGQLTDLLSQHVLFYRFCLVEEKYSDWCLLYQAGSCLELLTVLLAVNRLTIDEIQGDLPMIKLVVDHEVVQE